MDNTNGGPIDQNINPDLLASQSGIPTLGTPTSGTPLSIVPSSKPIDITPTDTATPTLAPITELTPVGSHLSDIAISSDSPIHEVVSTPAPTPAPQVESFTPAAVETPTPAPTTAVTPTPTVASAPLPQTPAVPFAEDPNLVKTI